MEILINLEAVGSGAGTTSNLFLNDRNQREREVKKKEWRRREEVPFCISLGCKPNIEKRGRWEGGDEQTKEQYLWLV